jgi:hypothetical protein
MAKVLLVKTLGNNTQPEQINGEKDRDRQEVEFQVELGIHRELL